MKGKVVLAYSGGLDTSVMAKWLQEKYNLDVVTLTVDVGQGDNLDQIKQRSQSVGAINHYSIDGKKEFVENYVYSAIKANALYQGKYPVSTAIARPLIAKKLVEVAKKENATAVAHGCTGKGNDQVRFEIAIRSWAPDLKIIAPVREWGLSREEEIEYAKEKNIDVPIAIGKQYSIDQNLWGRSIESGVLEQQDYEPPEEIFEWTTSPEKAPDKAERVKISFKEGVPCALNGKEMEGLALIQELNTLAGKHGIGRIDQVEDRLVGIKSREVYECPAAVVIIEAHKDLEKSVLTRHESSFKQLVDSQWTFLAYAGLWTDPLRDDLQAFIDKTQNRVTGDVKIKMYKGGMQVVGRSSPMSLYDLGLATYDRGTTFDQKWSAGFIEIWGLPSTVANKLNTTPKK